MERDYNILVAGAGQIGSRHLQGLMQVKVPAGIIVVDPSEESLRVTAERIKQAGENYLVRRIIYHKSVEDLDTENIDLAIIATNSNVRPAVVESLLGKALVHSMILEKVVYQSDTIFKQQIDLLERNNVKTWVNCPRREYKYYMDLKRSLPDDSNISIQVSGGNWGLGCNAVHYLDLFAYLTSDNNIKLEYDSLDRKILQSRRSGFSEFTGQIGFSNSRGRLSLISNAFSVAPLTVEITASDSKYIVAESKNTVIKITPGTPVPESKEVRFPFQSELTGEIASEILVSGNCSLPVMNESAVIHSAVFPPFNNLIEEITGSKPELCPIT